MSETGIELVANPRDADFEDYIAAYFQAGGLYVEKSIIYRGKAELLELDIITTDFQVDNIVKHLIEIKSGKWGFNEIFKVKGWMFYIKIDHGVFVIKDLRDSFEYFISKANELNITLINNADLNNTKNNLQNYLVRDAIDSDIESIRFAYLLERKILKRIKILKKRYPDYQCYQKLDDYFYKINSGSFFSSNPVRRINQLFNAYVKYKNITAKISHEIDTGEYDEEVTDLSRNGFVSCFYRCENNILQVSLYVEHVARITILKSCIQYLIKDYSLDMEAHGIWGKLDYLTLPNSIKLGLENISKEPYFHRYPIFWQFFTFVLGGFILKDFEQVEYEYLSDRSGIPIEEIPNAFDSYNKLFPKDGGWMHSLPYSEIYMHRFFPPAFCGIGANHRRMMYTNEEKEEIEFEELATLITGRNTMKDLVKWNNLGYEILK